MLRVPPAQGPLAREPQRAASQPRERRECRELPSRRGGGEACAVFYSENAICHAGIAAASLELPKLNLGHHCTSEHNET